MKNWVKTFWKVVRVIFAVFMIFAGLQHFLNTLFYIPFVPSFLPFTMAIIYISGVVEIVLGVMLLIPKYIRIGAMGIFLLMLTFLPVHVWDIFSETPAIGSHNAAMVRLPIQLLFIAIAWKVKDQ